MIANSTIIHPTVSPPNHPRSPIHPPVTNKLKPKTTKEVAPKLNQPTQPTKKKKKKNKKKRARKAIRYTTSPPLKGAAAPDKPPYYSTCNSTVGLNEHGECRSPPAPSFLLAYGTVLEYSSIPGPGMMDTLSYSTHGTSYTLTRLLLLAVCFGRRSVGRLAGWLVCWLVGWLAHSAGKQAGIPCRTVT